MRGLIRVMAVGLLRTQLLMPDVCGPSADHPQHLNGWQLTMKVQLCLVCGARTSAG